MENQQQQLEANFVTLAMSIASSAVMSMGLAPDPSTKKTSKDITLARFNIDLLDMLNEKTKGNLLKEEEDFMQKVTADLKMKFLEVTKGDKQS